MVKLAGGYSPRKEIQRKIAVTKGGAKRRPLVSKSKTARKGWLEGENPGRL